MTLKSLLTQEKKMNGFNNSAYAGLHLNESIISQPQSILVSGIKTQTQDYIFLLKYCKRVLQVYDHSIP